MSDLEAPIDEDKCEIKIIRKPKKIVKKLEDKVPIEEPCEKTTNKVTIEEPYEKTTDKIPIKEPDEKTTIPEICSKVEDSSKKELPTTIEDYLEENSKPTKLKRKKSKPVKSNHAEESKPSNFEENDLQSDTKVTNAHSEPNENEPDLPQKGSIVKSVDVNLVSDNATKNLVKKEVGKPNIEETSLHSNKHGTNNDIVSDDTTKDILKKELGKSKIEETSLNSNQHGTNNDIVGDDTTKDILKKKVGKPKIEETSNNSNEFGTNNNVVSDDTTKDLLKKELDKLNIDETSLNLNKRGTYKNIVSDDTDIDSLGKEVGKPYIEETSPYLNKRGTYDNLLSGETTNDLLEKEVGKSYIDETLYKSKKRSAYINSTSDDNIDDLLDKEVSKAFKKETSRYLDKLDTSDNFRLDSNEDKTYGDLFKIKSSIEEKLNSSNKNLDNFLNFDTDKYTPKSSNDKEKTKTDSYEDTLEAMDADELIKSIRTKYNISNETESAPVSQSTSSNLKFNKDSDKFIEDILRSVETEKARIKQRNLPLTTTPDAPKASIKGSSTKSEKQIAVNNKIQEMERYFKRLTDSKAEAYREQSMPLNDDNTITSPPQQVFHNNFARRSFGAARFRDSLSFSDRNFRGQQIEEKEALLNEKLNQVKDLIKKQTEVVENLGVTSQKLREFEATSKEARNISLHRIKCFEELEEGFDSVCQCYQEELNQAQEYISNQKTKPKKSDRSDMEDILNEFYDSLQSRRIFKGDHQQSRFASIPRFQDDNQDSIDASSVRPRRSSLINVSSKQISDYFPNDKFANSEFTGDTFADNLRKEYESLVGDEFRNGRQLKGNDDDFITRIRMKYNLPGSKDSPSKSSFGEEKNYNNNSDDLHSNIIKFNEDLTKAMSSQYNYNAPTETPATKTNYNAQTKSNLDDYRDQYNSDKPAHQKYGAFDSKSKLESYPSGRSKYGDKKLPSLSKKFSFDDDPVLPLDRTSYGSVRDISRDVDFKESLRNIKQFTSELQSADLKSRLEFNPRLSNIAETVESSK